jgi:hypothetical protein
MRLQASVRLENTISPQGREEHEEKDKSTAKNAKDGKYFLVLCGGKIRIFTAERRRTRRGES